MATRVLCADVLAVGRAEAILAPQAQARKPVPRTSILRSLRLRHTTPGSAKPPLHNKESTPAPPSAAPACQRAPPRGETTSARLLRHCRFTRSIRPPVPPRGSLLTGARKAYPPPATLSRLRVRVIAFCSFPAEVTRSWTGPRFPGRRSVPHPATLGTPSVYLDNATMSSRLPRAALRGWLARRRWAHSSNGIILLR